MSDWQSTAGRRVGVRTGWGAATIPPEWWVVAVSATAWLVLFPLTGAQGDGTTSHDHVHGHHAHVTQPGLAVIVLGWVVMTVAMMLPTTTPAIRYVALASLWRRRNRAIALYCVAFVGTWLPVALASVWWHTAGTPGRSATVAALACAALWELTPVKRKALRRCHRTAPIRARGWRADRSCLSYGLRNGLLCVVSCGPAMAAVVVSGHDRVITIGVAAALFAEKSVVRGERLVGLVAAVLLGAAVLAASPFT